MAAENRMDVGRRVELSISDPWEASTSTGARIKGTIVGTDSFANGADVEAIAVRLEEPLHWGGSSYPILVLTARHGQGLLEAVTDYSDLECNYVGLGVDQPLDDQALAHHVNDWRGGLAGRAAIRSRP